ncbi:hypothetical protein BDV12DRAFT_168893 [Aspergillus spectabilis]
MLMLKGDTMPMQSRLHHFEALRKWCRFYWIKARISMLKGESLAIHSRLHYMEAMRKWYRFY